MVENVNVSSTRKRTAGGEIGKRIPSPLGLGLLYGAGTGAIFGGPIGALVGAGVGILSKRLKQNYLDQEADRVEMLRGQQLALEGELNNEYSIADDDEKRILDHVRRLQQNGYEMLAAGDEGGQRLIETANTMLGGILTADSAQRKSQEASATSVQHGLIQSAANGYRTEFQSSLEQSHLIDTQASKVLDLIAQGVDPNKPILRTYIAELLSTGMGMFRDTPDALDAITQGSSALEKIPVIGQYAPDLVGAITTYVKSGDFKATPEDINRLALNMKSYAEKYATNKLAQLGEQTLQLDTFAKRSGAIPDDVSLRDYVTGGLKELKFNPIPNAPPPKQSTPTTALTEASKWLSQAKDALKRPTN